MSCKHQAKATTGFKPKQFDAHVQSYDVNLMRAFLDGTYATFSLGCDGFDINFRKGHKGSVLITVEEK